MKKIALLLVLLTLFSGCTLIKDRVYYKNIADQAISIFNSPDYDKKDIASSDLEALDKLVSEITHENQLINISDFIVKEDEFKTDEPNSYKVFVKDNECYMYYSDLRFDEVWETEMEIHRQVICNGYYATIYMSDFFPNYEDSLKEQKHNYVFSSYIKNEDNYRFIYRSSKDGTVLTVKLDLDGNTVSNIKLIYNDESDIEYINKM